MGKPNFSTNFTPQIGGESKIQIQIGGTARNGLIIPPNFVNFRCLLTTKFSQKESLKNMGDTEVGDLLFPLPSRGAPETSLPTALPAHSHSIIHFRGCLVAQTALMMSPDFQHILRVLNTNIDGRRKVMFALCKIQGIGRRFSNLICKKAEVDPNKRFVESTFPKMDASVIRRANVKPLSPIQGLESSHRMKSRSLWLLFSLPSSSRFRSGF